MKSGGSKLTPLHSLRCGMLRNAAWFKQSHVSGWRYVIFLIVHHSNAAPNGSCIVCIIGLDNVYVSVLAYQ